MASIRIIAGRLKGRAVPFESGKFGDADITPQKVKGAIFSMIGDWLHGRGFLDLYAGSGQIGFEALSRGADPVVMNDSDRRACEFIRSCIYTFDPAPAPLILNMDASRALMTLRDRGAGFDVIFLDPPYRKVKGEAGIYRDILQKIIETGVLSGRGIVIIQHFSGNIMEVIVGGLRLRGTRAYGTTSLSVYEPQS